jgi:hypothetical protein
VTLEVVHALSTCADDRVRESLEHAVAWLETHRHGAHLDEDTLLLLAAVTDSIEGQARKILLPFVRWMSQTRARGSLSLSLRETLCVILSVLGAPRFHLDSRIKPLLNLQQADGSWEGSARLTGLALLALRHAGVARTDMAVERGMRFLRGTQAWNEAGLVQNPYDVSILLHATALRALLAAGAEPAAAMGSLLTLVHHENPRGGWATGQSLPVDLMTTALALDALSMKTELAVEGEWSKRRAVWRLMASQNPDGGWPLYPDERHRTTPIWMIRGMHGSGVSSIDVTSAAVFTFAYMGNSDGREELAIADGVEFLLRKQRRDGLWPSDLFGSQIFTTARALEALIAANGENRSQAILRAIQALLRRQNEDGGWGEQPEGLSTPHHTAWVLRALAMAPGIAAPVLLRARKYFEHTFDAATLSWPCSETVVLPFADSPMSIDDLTGLWVMEAMVPGGAATRSRRTGKRRIRPLFFRSR